MEYKLYCIMWMEKPGTRLPANEIPGVDNTYVIAKSKEEAMGIAILNWDEFTDLDYGITICPFHTLIEEVRIVGKIPKEIRTKTLVDLLELK